MSGRDGRMDSVADAQPQDGWFESHKLVDYQYYSTGVESGASVHSPVNKYLVEEHVKMMDVTGPPVVNNMESTLNQFPQGEVVMHIISYHNGMSCLFVFFFLVFFFVCLFCFFSFLFRFFFFFCLLLFFGGGE